MVDIVGRAGLFLAGKVSPELPGVEISISERGAAAPLITVATDERGAYRYGGRDSSPSAAGAQTQGAGHVGDEVVRFLTGCLLSVSPSVGPLHSDRHYDISASKEGFVLSPLVGKQGDFKAFALAGVTFKVL